MVPAPAWAADFIGLPFAPAGRTRAGCDCWGLVMLVYAARAGFALPGHTDIAWASARDSAAVGEGITRVAADWIPAWAHELRALDVLVMRVMGHPIHVGVMVDASAFLHAYEGTDSILERVDSPAWHRRIVGAYRHPRLA